MDDTRQGMLRLVILIPVLNDWESLERLATEIRSDASLGQLAHLLIVDDGSIAPMTDGVVNAFASAGRTTVIHLRRNVGHQRAIVIGMDYATKNIDFDALLVMDGDGEDTPLGMNRLIEALSDNPGKIVLARRGRRSEGWRFRLGYRIYRSAFRALTGTQMAYGNFAIIPTASVRSLAAEDSIWSSLPATIARSSLPRTEISVDRGARYAGESRMNIYGLISHGLNSLAVFVDRIFIRIVGLGLLGLALSCIAFFVAIGLRVWTSAAIPGWTTTAAGISLVLALQIVSVSVLSMFIVVQQRTHALASSSTGILDEVTEFMGPGLDRRHG